MKKFRFFSLLLLAPMFRPPASAAAESEFLPNAHELFHPLLADPRELQYALRAVEPVSHKLLGEAAIGDYLGLYRWTLPGTEAPVQLSAGGGAFARFDLSGPTNDMQTVDFFGSLPLDIRKDRWSGRLMVYHTSSHLGDDYLKAHGGVTEKHSWDNVRGLWSYDANSALRLYGGYTYTFRTLPGAGRHALQGGAELTSPWFKQGHMQYYWANDFQSWERAHWNPAFNSQAGVKFAKSPRGGRAISLFVEFSTGRQQQGQFYLQQETRWGLGLKFDLTQTETPQEVFT